MLRKILLVEDDRDLSSTVKKFLTIKGFDVHAVFDGADAIDYMYEQSADLVLLDIKLPSVDGYAVAKEIRGFSTVPIIFLTSMDAQRDVERGFKEGGDDYIVKPFSLTELHLRIEAVLRRIYGNAALVQIDDELFFDPDKMVLYKDGEAVHLTEKELKLLSLFLQNRGKIVTKEKIFDAIYTYDETPNDASLRVFVNRLRKLIGKEKIRTLKQVGYLYAG